MKQTQNKNHPLMTTKKQNVQNIGVDSSLVEAEIC